MNPEIKLLAKRHKINLTYTRNGKRYYKSLNRILSEINKNKFGLMTFNQDSLPPVIPTLPSPFKSQVNYIISAHGTFLEKRYFKLPLGIRIFTYTPLGSRLRSNKCQYTILNNICYSSGEINPLNMLQMWEPGDLVPDISISLMPDSIMIGLPFPSFAICPTEVKSLSELFDKQKSVKLQSLVSKIITLKTSPRISFKNIILNVCLTSKTQLDPYGLSTRPSIPMESSAREIRWPKIPQERIVAFLSK